MVRLEESLSQSLRHYAAAILTAVLAVPLWFYGGVILSIVALLVSLVSCVATRHLVLGIKKANEQRHSLDQQLLQSQKLASIGELSSGIAHEINNPLAIIGQEAEWILHVIKKETVRNLHEIAEIDDSVQEIRRQVERCKDITHKLLDFARKKEPLIQAVDINRLIEDMAKLVEREAAHKGIKIVREYDRDLPMVCTDAPLLRQVMLNLLINATDAVQKDGIVTIGSTIAENDNGVDVMVRDDGCGIPPEHLDKIFDPFFTTKPPGKGTGLGLSISHGIITKLGGRISVVSKAGRGTTFTVNLPVNRGKEEHHHGINPKNPHSGRRGEVSNHAG